MELCLAIAATGVVVARLSAPVTLAWSHSVEHRLGVSNELCLVPGRQAEQIAERAFNLQHIRVSRDSLRAKVEQRRASLRSVSGVNQVGPHLGRRQAGRKIGLQLLLPASPRCRPGRN